MQKRLLTYPQRLFLWLLSYSLLLVGCVVVFQYHREKEFKAVELDCRLQLINTYILTELEDGVRMEDINLAEFRSYPDLRVSLLTPDGKVLYDNTFDPLQTDSHLDRAEILSALKTGSGYTTRRHSRTTGETYFYSATYDGEGPIVRTAVPYSLTLIEVLRADFSFIWVMAGVTLIMCILGFFATRRVGLHISRLSRFALSVENGERISDTEPFPHDELGDISNQIVRLYARLQQANADRDREHQAAMHEQQEKERIKKQLTNNINHELKTPVAAIQVCLETLLAHNDMDAAKRTEFLNRCMANAERLRSLLTDVSLLTRMDDGGSAISKEKVDLTTIISDVVADSAPQIEAAGITLNVTTEGAMPIYGNRGLLESIFNNLISNSVAYSGCSEITIESHISTDSKAAYIIFADNGCGVADEHLPHLFERFYRVDKGRSRAIGGTGLGLSIVRNAVLSHGGSITLSRRAGGGLMFAISIPIISGVS